MTAVAKGFVRGVAAPAQGGRGSTVGMLAVGAPDLDLPVQDERTIHREYYPELSTPRVGPGCEPVLSQKAGVSEIRLPVAVVTEGFIHGFATPTQSYASVF